MYTILVVDDEPSIRIVLRTALETRDYKVLLANNGLQALEVVAQETPDLIVLDWMMPGMNGLEVCQAIRADPATAHIPIIFLSAAATIDRKISGLESGADDYMTKPFEPRELLARISLQLRKAAERGQINPLTLLPGNSLIAQEITNRLSTPARTFAMLYFDLDDFKAYNDHLGFSWGDRLLKVFSETIQQVMTLYGGDDRFVGHIGGDDFVAVTTPEYVEAVCQHVIAEFERRASAFCAETDDWAGGFDAIDRNGVLRHFDVPSLSIGVVSNQFRTFSSYLDVGQVAAQVKKAAKKKTGNAYFVDRRQDDVAINGQPSAFSAN